MVRFLNCQHPVVFYQDGAVVLFCLLPENSCGQRSVWSIRRSGLAGFLNVGLCIFRACLAALATTGPRPLSRLAVSGQAVQRLNLFGPNRRIYCLQHHRDSVETTVLHDVTETLPADFAFPSCDGGLYVNPVLLLSRSHACHADR